MADIELMGMIMLKMWWFFIPLFIGIICGIIEDRKDA